MRFQEKVKPIKLVYQKNFELLFLHIRCFKLLQNLTTPAIFSEPAFPFCHARLSTKYAKSFVEDFLFLQAIQV